MSRVSPALIVCAIGLLLVVYAGVGLATAPSSSGGVGSVWPKTQKAPPPVIQERDFPSSVNTRVSK